MFPKALPTPLRLAQAIGITTSLLTTGLSFSSSYLVIPRLLESPTHLLTQQWRSLYHRGLKTAIPLILTSSTAYFYLSYKFYSAHPKVFGGEWKVNLLAGLLMLGGAGYTRLVMGGVNGELLRRAEEMEVLKGKEKGVVEVAGRGETVHALVDWWGLLNLGRAAIFAIAGCSGTYAALG